MLRRGILALVMTALAVAEVHAQSTSALLDTIEHASFQYFWSEVNPANGLIRDRSTLPSPCSIAANGFGLSAICVGIDHGWIARQAGRDRVLTTLQTFWNGPQGTAASGTIGYKGLFYHFLDMSTATRTWNSELSSIDTALLMAGVLDVKQYFDGSDSQELQIRALSDSIYYRADWNWMRNFSSGILMGWKPGSGFSGFGQWIGYNEAMILYLLALGSPTHPVPTTAWNAWTTGYQWQTQYGYTYVIFPPLFGHQYSHCWVDFRLARDAYMQSKGITYFENSRRATLAQRAYCIANPGQFAGYSDSLWGLTASDDPAGYSAHGAPPAQNDNGTITPTAAASSIAFAPEVAIPAMRNMYNAYSSQLWGPYGFKDAFNLTANWWDTDYLGIDQGPIVLMIENYRTGAVWNRFMRNPDVLRGLQRAGFVAVVGVDGHPRDAGLELYASEPNPFSDQATIRFRLPEEGPVRLTVHDLAGREVAKLADGVRPAGINTVMLSGRNLPSGVYYYRLVTSHDAVVKKCVRLR